MPTFRSKHLLETYNENNFFSILLWLGVLSFTYPGMGIHNDVTLTMMLLTPTLNIFVGQPLWAQITSFVLYVVGNVAVLIYNLIMGIDRIPLSNPWVIRIMAVNQWANLVTGNMVIVIFLFLIMKTLNDNTKQIKKVAKCILELDLDNEFVNKILQKSVRNSSTNIQILQNIIRNVGGYKSYLPASLYKKEIAENEERTSSKSVHSENSDKKGDNSSHSSHSSRNSKGSKNSNGSGGDSYIDVSIFQRRKVSSMLIDINGYHEMMSTVRNLRLIERFTTQYLEYMENCVLKQNGVIHSIDGDKIVCTWNSMKKSINPELHACFAANECSKFDMTKDTCLKALIERGKSIGNMMDENLKVLINLDFSVAVVTDFLVCGNIGSSRTKRFVQTGFGMSLLYSMVKLCKKFDMKILIDENTKCAIGLYHFRTLPVSDVVYGEFSLRKNPTIRVYSLGKKKIKDENQEWLYAISNDLSDGEDVKTKDGLINAFWELNNRRAFKKCADELELIKKGKFLNEKMIKYLDDIVKEGLAKSVQLKNQFSIITVD